MATEQEKLENDQLCTKCGHPRSNHSASIPPYECYRGADHCSAWSTPKPAVPGDGDMREQVRNLAENFSIAVEDKNLADAEKCIGDILQLFASQAAAAQERATRKVDRFEVIDDTGRAYVKGSIYGTPVKIQLSYQDDDRTLKVFVQDARVVASAAHPKQPNDGGDEL